MAIEPLPDLLGLDLLDDSAPVGTTVAEVVASLPDSLPAEQRVAKLGQLRSELAFEGVLLLPDDVSPLKETRMREFLALVGAGYTDKDAAAAVGYSRWAVIGWKRNCPGFVDAYNRAKHVNVDALIAEAKRRALHGSDRLLEFLLCNLAPEQFKRQDTKVDVNVSLADRIAAGRKRTNGE